MQFKNALHVESYRFFLAVIKNDEDLGSDRYDVFFVNNSDLYIERLGINCGVSAGDEEEYFADTLAYPGKGPVPERSYILIDTLWNWDFDFHNNYQILMKTKLQNMRINFYIPTLVLGDKKKFIPLLNRSGRLIFSLHQPRIINKNDRMEPRFSNIEKAIEIALKAHKGQKDKAGAPYILHPLRIMLAMEGESEKLAAVLHDVLEDSAMTVGDLSGEGIPDEVCSALTALTKQEGEPYDDYLMRVKANPIGLKVKLADLKDNMDLGRIANPTEKDLKRFKKYQKAYYFLNSVG